MPTHAVFDFRQRSSDHVLVRIERDVQADSEETDDDIDKLDPRITEQNPPELVDHEVLEEIVTIAPRPRRMRFNEPWNSNPQMQMHCISI